MSRNISSSNRSFCAVKTLALFVCAGFSSAVAAQSFIPDIEWPLTLALPIELPQVQKKQLRTHYQTDSRGEQIKAASLQSGMAFKLNNAVMDFDLDYTLEGRVKKQAEVDQGEVNHRMSGRLRSQPINQLFKIDAAIVASSAMGVGGESYQHRLRSELQRPIKSLCNLKFSYNHDIERRDSLADPEQRSGYSVDLDGKWLQGLLRWNTRYDAATLTNSDDKRLLENWSLNSQYQLRNDLSIKLGSTVERRSKVDELTLFDRQQRRYTAGLNWSPLADYSLEFNVNKLDSGSDDEQYFGSGAIIWSPKPLLQLELSYKDQLLPGRAGVLFSASIKEF